MILRSRPKSPSKERVTLLVASGGGHLRQLHRLESRLQDVPARRVWVTFDTPQSRSLLADAGAVYFARFVGPRDVRAVLANLRLAAHLLRRYDVRALVSTGSGLALSFFGPARLMGVPCHYVESAARTDGPSLTGRILSRLPRVRLYTQYRHWSDEKWRYRGAVIDDLRPSERTPGSRPLRVAVTLGTIPYSFERLTRRLASILPRDAEVYWQTGSTDPEGLPGTAARTVPHAELVEAMRAADVVVAHAGVGSALDALDVGRPPVLVFREAQHGEHVDDHQRQIANLLGERGVAFPVSAEELTLDDLERAARLEVRWGDAPATFPLD